MSGLNCGRGRLTTAGGRRRPYRADQRGLLFTVIRQSDQPHRIDTNRRHDSTLRLRHAQTRTNRQGATTVRPPMIPTV